MRIQLILISALFAFTAMASEDKDIKDLFKKYDLVMDQKQTELVDEVFTKNFIKSSGGKEELIQKIKELPKTDQKSLPKMNVSWKKGVKDEVYFATLKEASSNKSKHADGSEFIILKEDGKFKINGTLGDGN